MLLNSKLSRRTVIIGGLSAPLIACGPNGIELPEEIPWARIGLFLTIATVAASASGVLLGAVGATRVASLMFRAGAGADRANSYFEGIQAANQLRLALFPPPDQYSNPRPFIPDSSTQQAYQTSDNTEVNNFDIVPVFGQNITLKLGVLNNEGANFGAYDLYATVKRVDEPVPTTYREIWGSGDLPHVIVSPPTSGNFSHDVHVPVPLNGAYVSYSWKVPRGEQPTNEFIANNVFIGPAFLTIDETSYASSVQEYVIPGKNLEARFQLPT